MKFKVWWAFILILISSNGISQVIPWNHEMFSKIPRPIIIEEASRAEDLIKYLNNEASTELQWVTMFKIAEIGGEKAVYALLHFYEKADSACGEDSGELPKAGALRLIGKIGGSTAKRTLLDILEQFIHKASQREHALSSSYHNQIIVATIDGLCEFYDDDEVYETLAELSLNLPHPLRSTKAVWAEAALMRMDIRRAGIDSLPVSDQVAYLLDKITGPGFGKDTVVAPGRWTHEAVVTEAVTDVLCDDYGSQISHFVEEYTADRINDRESGVISGLQRVMAGIRACKIGEEHREKEIMAILKAYNQPGSQLIVQERGGHKYIVPVPEDSTIQSMMEK